MKASQDLVQVYTKQANKRILYWYLNDRLKDVDVDENETQKEMLARVERYHEGVLPVKIDVPRALVEDPHQATKGVPEAPEHKKDWPGDPDLMRDGYDEHGNEYWCAVKFVGPSRQAANHAPGSRKNEIHPFQINGLEVRLSPGREYCLRGRWVKFIRSLQDTNLPSIDNQQDELGHPVAMRGNWVKPTLEHPPRYEISIINFLGPTGTNDRKGVAKEHRMPHPVYLPNKRLLHLSNIEYDEDTIRKGLAHAKQVDEARKQARQRESAARARAIMQDRLSIRHFKEESKALAELELDED